MRESKMEPMKILTVDLTQRLPDINRHNDLPEKYNDYGRIAVDHNGNISVMGVQSSHPSNTKVGFYWATAGDTLYISPRGCTEDLKEVNEDVIRAVGKKLGIRNRYKYFKIIKE